MVLTEAFEIGLPVVAYDITAVGPLVTDGREGYLAKSFDTKAFADKMYQITRDTKERQHQMAAYALEKADSLAIEKIIIQWKDLLKAE